MAQRYAIAAAAILCLCAPAANAADQVKIAMGGFGAWSVEAPRLGKQAGIFQKHGIDIDYYATAGAGETLQALLGGAADLSVGMGTIGAMGAFAKGAPIRVIGANFTGAGDLYWYVRADSQIRGLKDIAEGTVLSFSSNGSSSNAVASALVAETGAKARLLATGDMASTLTQVMSGQIEIGWATPPFGLKDIEDGKIRIVATGNDASSLRDQTVRVDVASLRMMRERPDVLARYVAGYRETLAWMFSDPRAVTMWAQNIDVPVSYATVAAERFQPKTARNFDSITGLDALMASAVKQKFLTQPLSGEQLATLIQIVP